MINSSEICKDDQRRDAVRHKSGLNGLDYLDVGPDQRTLTVYFLGKAPSQIDKTNVRIDGGRRIRDVQVLKVEVKRNPEPDLDDRMIVSLDKYGDFTTYTLRVVEAENGKPGNTPRRDFDPRYAKLDFTFKVDCPSDLDCASADTCPPPTLVEPEINYLAKDYASFRQLILDRLALIMPDWKERHVPDLGIALVEVLAYVGDYLSYYQDAVGTEAYLDTARQRISVRRHARLVDYVLHEGCNARAWVCVETDSNWVDSNALDPKQVFFVTGYNGALSPEVLTLTAAALQQIPSQLYEVFEPVTTQPISLYAAHSRMCFYTWGERECCLPRGATSATLLDTWNEPPNLSAASKPNEPAAAQRASTQAVKAPSPSPEPKRQLHLQVGDVLIFEEVIGPKTGNPSDADPTRRHPVRLTKVTASEDSLYDPPVPVVEIEWAAEDALPFPFCISAIGPAPDCAYIPDISIARGNVILVDHGLTVQPPEDLGQVPLEQTKQLCDCEGHPTDIMTIPGRFRPHLRKTPLTFREPIPPAGTPASRLLKQKPRQALPQVVLSGIPAVPDGTRPLFELSDLDHLGNLVDKLRKPDDSGAAFLLARLSPETRRLVQEQQDSTPVSTALAQALSKDLAALLQTWVALGDLLSSGADERHFVVEIDNDGIAWLRFGNGELGEMPEAGSELYATYRVGNGGRGNVGAEVISHLVSRTTTYRGGIVRVRNPLPASGGVDPEPVADAKLFAPTAFRKELQRAITAGDYAELAKRDFKDRVQLAAAALDWTGSWYEAQVAVDPYGSEETAPRFLDEIKDRLSRYRRIGHDLAVLPARYVSLDIGMIICVLPHYLRGHVEAALLDVLSTRVLPDGRLGFFHPDNLTFGEGIYLSKLVAAAQAVKGVESVTVTKLERLYEGDNNELKNGVLPLGPLEVARLDSDPSFPEHGRLVLDMRGGR